MQAAPQPLLRPGLLAGQVIAVAGRTGGVGRAAAAACGELGAHVEQVGDEGHRVDLADEGAVRAAIAAIAAPERALHTVVVDAASLFAEQPGADERLRAALAATWVVVRAAATEVMIDAPEGGKVVLLAPAPATVEHAGPLRAGLENLARELSIEWSRYGIRITSVAPGARTRADQVADVVAYLASPAGDYFSGCVLSLDGL